MRSFRRQPTARGSGAPVDGNFHRPHRHTVIRWSSQDILARLARRTSAGTLIAEIEGLRFIAIALVVLFHLAGYVQYYSPVAFDPPHQQDWLFSIATFGDRGVNLFFTVSGFVLAVPFARHHLLGAPAVSLPRYLWRRVTRLEPPYVASMLLLYLLLVAVNGRNPIELLPNLLASVLYLHNLVYAHASAINGVAWSLEVEVQFYLLAPLMGTVFAIRHRLARRAVIIAAMGLAVALQVVVGMSSPRFVLSLGNYIQYFLAGFLLCDIYYASWGAAPTLDRRWDLVTLVGWPALFALWHNDLFARSLGPLLSVVVFCAAFKGPITRLGLTNPWVVTIGGMCYTIYLIHYAIISGIGRLAVPRLAPTNLFWVNYLLVALVVIPVVLVLSAIWFALIERPCMDKDWPSKLGARVRNWRTSPHSARG